MRYSLRLLTLTLTAVWLTLTSLAQAEPLPEPPQVPVRAYVLEDSQSGRTLAALNADERMEPASITKLMSAYVIYKSLREGSIKPGDQVAVSEKAWRMEGSRMFVEVDTKVAVEDLIMGMVVQSGNDATVALAEHIAGSEEAFAALMNQQAAQLGMKNSHFMNATGLPNPEHYSTARDIAILSRAIIVEFPEQYTRYKTRSFTYNDITQHNRNRLLWQDESVDGIKTGHTASAGYCLSASAQRGNTRLITVVLGAETEKNRFSASQSLLNYGFRFFETHKLYDANNLLTEARIWKGEVEKLPLGLANDLYVTIPKGKYNDMHAALNINASIEAPAPKGTPFGSVTVTLDDQVVADAPLVALQTVNESGLFGRMVDEVFLMFNALFE